MSLSLKTWAVLVVGAVGVGVVYALSRKLNLSGASLNPFNADNVVNRVANAAVQEVTGDANQTVGGAMFDLFNPDAGLGAGETSPTRGVIVSPRVAPVASLPAGWIDPIFASYQAAPWAETPAGAVTGRTIFR